MSEQSHIFDAEIWLHEGPAAWFFISLPDELADGLRAAYAHSQRAFGSLPVRVQIGATDWKTSIFYDRKRDTYLLPVKSAVRKREHLEAGETVRVELTPVI